MVFISNHSEKGKHYFTFFIIISGRYLLVTFYEFINLRLLAILKQNVIRNENWYIHEAEINFLNCFPFSQQSACLRNLATI